jgi:creatinine amidohydrolase
MFVNGHGGNIATVNAAFYEIYSHRHPILGVGQPARRCAAN